MTTTPRPTQDERVRVYRKYRRGEVTEDEVRESFGEDLDEFESFVESMELADDSVTNEASAELFD